MWGAGGVAYTLDEEVYGGGADCFAWGAYGGEWGVCEGGQFVVVGDYGEIAGDLDSGLAESADQGQGGGVVVDQEGVHGSCAQAVDQCRRRFVDGCRTGFVDSPRNIGPALLEAELGQGLLEACA